MAMAFQYSHTQMTNKMQQLYDRCDMVFSGGHGGQTPPLHDICWLRDFLGTIEAVDLGIDGKGVQNECEENEERRLFPGTTVDDITYMHIYECDDFSIGVFCFPAGATLPLHDHPEMVVLSRVLYGSVVHRAYDWVQTPDRFNGRKCGLARLAVDDHVLQDQSPVSVLFPTSGGNIHSFTALTPCAFLDVLSPPYSEEEDRDATYFSEIPIANLSDFAILKEMEIPEDLTVRGAPYIGPEIVVNDCGYDEEEKEEEEEEEDEDDDDV